MKQLFLVGIFLHFNLILSSQIKLPFIPDVKIKNCAIKTYSPRGTFIKMFPNFEKNGNYLFNYDFVISGPMDLDYEGFYGLNTFNNFQFPAQESISKNSFMDFSRFIIQFTTSNFSYFRLDADNYIKSKTALNHPDIYNLNKQYSNSYIRMNKLYKETISRIIASRNGVISNISDLGTLDFENAVLDATDIVLQFVYVQSNTWMQEKTADKFPSHSLFKLIVKNVDGDTLQTYGQAVFFEGDHGKWSRPKLTEYFVISNTFPIAFENLVNQFLNDSVAFEKIKKQRRDIQKKITEIQGYSSLLNIKNRYNIIRSKKEQIRYDLLFLGVNYDITSYVINESKQEIDNTSIVLGNNGAAALSSLITGWIMKNQQKKEMQRYIQMLTTLKVNVDILYQEERSFIESIPKELFQLSEIAVLLNSSSMNAMNTNKLVDILSAKQDFVLSQIKTTYNSVFQESVNKFYEQFNVMSTNSKSETLGVKNEENPSMSTVNSSNTGNICQQKATSEWYKSSEYLAYQSTKLNADASDCKAKLIELTIKYCADNLPSAELENMKKVAAGERRVADELRKEGFSFK